MTLFKKIAASAFIVVTFLTMVRVHMPLEKKGFETLYRPIDKYLSFFSIYQDWMMFAPNVGKIDMKLSAEVVFQDGSTATYQFPDSSQMSLIEKYTYGEKFRKLILEGISRDRNNYMWNDAAKFALRKIKQENYDKIPLKVHLTREWDQIPKIETLFRPHAFKNQNLQKYTFYTYEVIR